MIEIDQDGRGDWRALQNLTIPTSGYTYHVFADDTPGEWIRFRASGDAKLSAYLHYQRAAGRQHPHDKKLFAGLRPHDDPGSAIVVRPAGHNRNLQAIVHDANGDIASYVELDEQLQIAPTHDEAQAKNAHELLAMQPLVEYDQASAIVTDHQKRRYRLPMVAGVKPLGRDVREVQSERSLVHVGNIFYEAPRGDAGKEIVDYRRMRPVASHGYAIHDFCTWRGLLVLAGARPDTEGDGHVVALPEGRAGLWFGCVDDLWKLGKPVGVGGPWKESPAEKDTPSDPFLMTGFDRKTLHLTHDAQEEVQFRIEVDYSNRDFWKVYQTVAVPPGETVTIAFPEGYAAHWARLMVDRNCRATALFQYE